MRKWFFVLTPLLALGLCMLTTYATAQDAQKGTMDQKFVMKASTGNLAEVRLGKLAEKRSTNDDIKKFGQRMVDDHTKANDDLRKIADKKGYKIAESLDKKHQELETKLSKLRGTEFDREYVSEMLKDHKEDIKLFQNQAKDGTDESLKSYAKETLPTLTVCPIRGQPPHDSGIRPGPPWGIGD